MSGTNKEFLDDGDDDDNNLLRATLSFDQELGRNWGAFLRVGWQDDSALVDYDALYSGGLDIKGRI